jgi:hypothetical protein
MSDYYDRDGNPLTLDQYCKTLDANGRDKRVGFTRIDADVSVSTVWLALDHQWGEGEPLIFETMIFGGDYDVWGTRRYSTEEAAMRGHLRVVDALRSGTFTEND